MFSFGITRLSTDKVELTIDNPTINFQYLILEPSMDIPI